MSQALAPRQNRKPLRALLLTLPAFMLVAAFTLITLSPTVWPPTGEANYPRWLPTASSLVMALAGGSIGVYALRQVYVRTLGDFEVMGLQIPFGVLAFLSGGALLFNWAFMMQDQHEVSTHDPGGPGASDFISATLIGLFAMAVVWCGVYIYVHAISNTRANALTLRRPDEVDGVGELLRDKPRLRDDDRWR